MDEKTLKKSDVDKSFLKEVGISEDVLESPLWDNSDFVSELTNCFDVDEIQACFEENGHIINDYDASKILRYVVYNIAEDETGFASDYDMELCAGGQKPAGSQTTSQSISNQASILPTEPANTQRPIPADEERTAINALLTDGREWAKSAILDSTQISNDPINSNNIG